MNNHNPKQQYSRTLGGMGTTELIIGILMLVFGIFTVAAQIPAANHYIKIKVKEAEMPFKNEAINDMFETDSTFTYTSQGIWCGTAIIVTGVLGLMVKSKPTQGMYIANMIMAIATTHVAIIATVLSVFAVDTSFFSVALIVAHSFIGLLSAVAAAVTVTHTVYCFNGACYGGTSATNISVSETASGHLYA